MSKSTFVLYIVSILSFINPLNAQTIPSIIQSDISIGGSSWPDVSSSLGNVELKSGIPDDTILTFDHMDGRTGNNNNMDYYSVIEGDLTIDANQLLILEQESYLVINGNLIINGTFQYNNSSGNSKHIYLVVLGDITGSGTITGGNGAHDKPPYASGTITVGGDHKGGSGDNIRDLDNYIITTLEGAGYELPVELISFTASKNKENIQIDWSTASEINASHFEIYSSTDKKVWSLLDTKEASGNSNTRKDYSFTDQKEYSNFVYYKLIQYDFDGQNETFGPIKVSLDEGESPLAIDIYPNPSSSKVNIQVSGLKANGFQIQILSKEGKIITSQSIHEDNLQSYLFRINERIQLQPGFYFIRTKSGNEEKIEKLIIQ